VEFHSFICVDDAFGCPFRKRSPKLGLLTRTQNDWRAVEELTTNLRKFDVSDPVKYDFALFGLGAFEKF